MGKSWMTAAVCRHLYQRGLRVAPFKAQNMSNNSHPLPGGAGEIGRAQVAQAEACGLEPRADFNPILLKPNSDTGSQVIVNGRVWRTLAARDYYQHHDYLLEQVLAAHERLSGEFDYIVMEGAGSVAELNLKRTDLVNLNLARRTGARALLVGDIDRGGIFASIIGTLCLLDAEEKALVPAFAVNRFRGDRSLFDNGVRILEEKTERRCLGVFPYAMDIHLDEEDGVAVDGRRAAASDVAILRFPRISNLTDFRLLPDASWIDAPQDRQFHCVILPGTKNTLADLGWLRERKLDDWVQRQLKGGARVVGVCGGYQML
ncbi:MAG: cobyric acid synthase, partial [Bryobacteraceae bacterium]|nr:cobyric acid synthase [Bryobacteraceae bacterium]